MAGQSRGTFVWKDMDKRTMLWLNNAGCPQQVVPLSHLLSILSGRGLMSTSKRSCTWFSTSESFSDDTKVMARPLVPKRPARPTCTTQPQAQRMRQAIKARILSSKRRKLVQVSAPSCLHTPAGPSLLPRHHHPPCAGRCLRRCRAGHPSQACRS